MKLNPGAVAQNQTATNRYQLCTPRLRTSSWIPYHNLAVLIDYLTTFLVIKVPVSYRDILIPRLLHCSINTPYVFHLPYINPVRRTFPTRYVLQCGA